MRFRSFHVHNRLEVSPEVLNEQHLVGAGGTYLLLYRERGGYRGVCGELRVHVGYCS